MSRGLTLRPSSSGTGAGATRTTGSASHRSADGAGQGESASGRSTGPHVPGYLPPEPSPYITLNMRLRITQDEARPVVTNGIRIRRAKFMHSDDPFHSSSPIHAVLSGVQHPASPTWSPAGPREPSAQSPGAGTTLPLLSPSRPAAVPVPVPAAAAGKRAPVVTSPTAPTAQEVTLGAVVSIEDLNERFGRLKNVPGFKIGSGDKRDRMTAVLTSPRLPAGALDSHSALPASSRPQPLAKDSGRERPGREVAPSSRRAAAQATMRSGYTGLHFGLGSESMATTASLATASGGAGGAASSATAHVLPQPRVDEATGLLTVESPTRVLATAKDVVQTSEAWQYQAVETYRLNRIHVVKERNAMRQDLRRKNMVIEQQRKHAAADMHQFSNFLVSMRAVASQQGGTSSGGSTVV